MKTEQIERIVNRGLDSLRNSIDVYWPAIGDENDMTERNLSIHVAHSFIQSGWAAHGEACFQKNASKHLDLLLLHEETNTFVSVESKILHDGNRARGITKDVERILSFRPDPKEFTSKTGFGLILTATWNREIKNWWISHASSPKEDSAGESWEELGQRLNRAHAIRRARWLLDNDGPKTNIPLNGHSTRSLSFRYKPRRSSLPSTLHQI